MFDNPQNYNTQPIIEPIIAINSILDPKTVSPVLEEPSVVNKKLYAPTKTFVTNLRTPMLCYTPPPPAGAVWEFDFDAEKRNPLPVSPH